MLNRLTTFFSILSLLPIAVLLLISLLKGVKPAIYSALLVTAILFFIWDSTWPAFPAAFVAAFIDTFSILMIVFGAILLYHTMEQKGFIAGIKQSLEEIHPERNFRFYFLAFFLTAFFESVAGFGTPGAIVPLLLISMGYSPILSISVVLLIDGLFAISGAVGTPVTAGLAKPLSLPLPMLADIYLYASISMAVAGFVVLFFIIRFLKQEQAGASQKGIWLYLSIMLPFLGLSYYLLELSGILASVVMAIISYLFFFTNRQLRWKPWLPYLLLVVLLLLPKLFPSLATLLSYELSFNTIFGTEVSASLQPLRSPLIPFVLATLFATAYSGKNTLSLKPVLAKTLAVFLVLFPSLAITRLMLASGTDMPSMVEALATIFTASGKAYPALSPFIGVLGAFMTGSTTVSNVIFGPAQFNAAQQLLLPEERILALQLAGASLGNAICLFNIIAAAAVAGVENYRAILKYNLPPVLIATVIISLIGYLLIAWT